MRMALQKEVSRNGNTIQKYSLIQIRNTNCRMKEIAKMIQYLVTDSLSILFSMTAINFDKYKVIKTYHQNTHGSSENKILDRGKH